MEKLVKLIPLALFCLFFIKIGAIGGSYVDVAALAVVAIYIISMKVQNKDYEISAMHSKIEDLESVAVENQKEIEKIRSYVTSQKIQTLGRGLNVK